MVSKFQRILKSCGLKKNGIDVKKINPFFGAKIISGLNLKNITYVEKIQLKSLLKEKGMLVIPSHRILSEKEQVKLTSIFGTTDKKISYISQHTNINNSSVTNDKVYLSSPLWHCDDPYLKSPPHISIFQMLEGKNQNWGTDFISLYQVCTTISEAFKKKWVGINIMYSGNDVTHPLLHIHPYTGKQSLYFDFRFAKEVFNFCKSSGEILLVNSNVIVSKLNELFSEHTSIYNHKWCSGDIVIIDNYAISRRETTKPDYINNSIIRRTTTKGVYF